MGFYGKSKKAEEETNKKAATEIINLKITNAQIESYTQTRQMPTLYYLAEKLENDSEIEYVNGGKEKVASIADVKLGSLDQEKNYETILTKLNAYPYVFEIDENLKLAKIDGFEIADTKNTVTREEYDTLKLQCDTLLEKMQTLENQPKNIERVSLMDEAVIIPTQLDTDLDKNHADIQLSDSIENYKYIEIQYDLIAEGGNGASEETKLLATNQLIYKDSDTLSWTDGSTVLMNILYHQNVATIAGWFKNNKLLHIGHSYTTFGPWDGIQIKKIYGIR